MKLRSHPPVEKPIIRTPHKVTSMRRPPVARLPQFNGTRALTSIAAFYRRIPKRLLVATLAVALYRGLCGYQMTYIDGGILKYLTGSSTNFLFPEYNLVSGWFHPDLAEWPHAVFGLIAFFDTIGLVLMAWWMVLAIPRVIRRCSPMKGRGFKH